MFTELAPRAATNMGEYPEASERYGRLAFKAQSNCRTTLNALAKLHQPREQTVRHVHVSEGGRAIVADHFHKHEGSPVDAHNDEQCDATRGAGDCASCLTRTRKRTECQSPAVSGKRRCRMHGGTNLGPPLGDRNARKHGGRSAAAIQAARYLRMIACIVRDDDVY
ncbi:HGGxSTG domain-containing protein [Sphingomonas sp. Tas61C01]|uniref:HGGxSTG domain-containing protein n=1 Tax=Sphingomonas sp. Tas61C01 TaxID=3458297 RepID=UPI00403E7507